MGAPRPGCSGRAARGAAMKMIDLQPSDIAADDVYDFTYPQAPGRWQGVAEKFPGLPQLVVDPQQRVVCGHDRLPLLRLGGGSRFVALMVDLPAAECLLLNYNILERLFGLNLYEKLLFLKKVSPLLPAAGIRRRANLGFPLDDELRLRLDVLLTEPFRSCLAAGRLGLRTALKLAAQDERDRLAQLSVFRTCGFSDSRQWQLAQMVEEIAFRAKKTVAAVLADRNLQQLLQGEMPQEKVLAALHGLRYPALTRREKEWQAWHLRAEAGGGLALAHAPQFAREEIQVTLTVKNRAAAEKLLQQLKKSPLH
jgi:hypothetical protein